MTNATMRILFFVKIYFLYILIDTVKCYYYMKHYILLGKCAPCMLTYTISHVTYDLQGE